MRTVRRPRTPAPGAADYASLDRWDGEPAPLILCESRSLAGVLSDVAARYACPVASTNGHARGFLITKVAPRLRVGQRVLDLGDWDHCGHQIEAATHRTLTKHARLWSMSEYQRDRRIRRATRRGRDTDIESLWERLALTTEQVEEHNLPIIQKPDRRGGRVQYFDAVETEAFGQARIVDTVQARLDELMPEPLDDVLEREEVQRAEVVERLRRMG